MIVTDIRTVEVQLDRSEMEVAMSRWVFAAHPKLKEAFEWRADIVCNTEGEATGATITFRLTQPSSPEASS